MADASRLCGACGENIPQGEAVLAMGRRWHEKCWLCNMCKASLCGVLFYPLPSRRAAVCEKCHIASERICRRCQKPVTSAAMIIAGGHPYHKTCWTCTGPCGRVLTTDDDFYFEEDAADEPLCQACFHVRLGAVQCANCEEPLHLPFVRLGSLQFHPKCFRCHLCSRDLQGVEPVISDPVGHPLCATCCDKAPKCEACGEVIVEDLVSAGHVGVFHNQCFTCCDCDKLLEMEEFVEQDQGPVCVDCYQASYAPTCTHCGKPILDEEFVTVKGKPLHGECLNCSKCGHGLTPKSFCRSTSTGLVCGPCTGGGPMSVPQFQHCEKLRASPQSIDMWRQHSQPIMPEAVADGLHSMPTTPLDAPPMHHPLGRFRRSSSEPVFTPMQDSPSASKQEHVAMTPEEYREKLKARRRRSSNSLPPLRTRASKKKIFGDGLSNAILDHPTGDIHDFYEFGKPLGDGVAGTVFAATHKTTQEKVAVKAMSKAKSAADMDAMRREVQIMWMLQDCDKVVEIIDAFEDFKTLYVVMEFCSGGDLISLLCEGDDPKPLSEEDVAKIIHDVVSVINVCHDFGVIHKDIKPENFLFTCHGPERKLKCTDFGMSVFFEEGKRLDVASNPGGTHAYMAPEMAAFFMGQHGSFGKEIDIWAAGVMLYTLLSGFFPFDDTSGFPQETLFMPVDFEQGFENVSDEVMDLITHMLCKRPEDRPTAVEILHHPWVSCQTASTEPLGNALIQRMKKFNRRSLFQKAAITSAARNLTPDEIGAFRRAFQAYDENKDGFISLGELTNVLRSKGEDLGHTDLAEMVTMLHKGDASKPINYEEFLAATMAARSMLYEENISAAFEAFDVDKDGKISKDELTQALSSVGMLDKDTIVSIIAEADRDGDGVIDYFEFVQYMRKQQW